MTFQESPAGLRLPLSRRFRPAPIWLAAALLFGTATAWAQRTGMTVTPSVSGSVEFTDNRDLSATNPQSDMITTLSPRVRWFSQTGRVRGSVDYALNLEMYARDSSDNNFQNDLSANVAAELIERHFFIDASASISQQSVSAFGLQGDRPAAINSNTTEYAELTVSPSLRGRLFGSVDAEARLTSQFGRSLDGSVGDTVNHEASVSLGGGSGAVGWSLVASRTYNSYEDGRDTLEDRIRPEVSYTVHPGLRFFVSGGYERNDILTIEPTSYKNWGGGFDWQPSPRTRFMAQTEQRYFGPSYSVSLSHRMRRWVLSYTDVYDDSETTTGAGTPQSTYDIFFAQFASIEPDPALRDVLVRNFLRSAGLDVNEQQSAGFISSAVTVTRNQNLSLAWQGRRNNAVLSAFSTASRRVDEISDAQDDLSQVGRVEQQGVSLSLSHRLTPTASVVLYGSLQRTPGSETVEGNDLNEISLSWSERIGSRATVAVTGRRAQAVGANPYTESSLAATFNVSF